MSILIWVNYPIKWSVCYSWSVAQPSTSLKPVCYSATLTNPSSVPVNNPYSPPSSPLGRSHPRVSLFILPAGFNQFLSMCSIYLPPSNTDPQPWREIRWKLCITGLQSWISLYFLPLFFAHFDKRLKPPFQQPLVCKFERVIILGGSEGFIYIMRVVECDWTQRGEVVER